jgi:hypothetical protein
MCAIAWQRLEESADAACKRHVRLAPLIALLILIIATAFHFLTAHSIPYAFAIALATGLSLQLLALAWPFFIRCWARRMAAKKDAKTPDGR